MSYLLEVLGRGLLLDLRTAYARQMPALPEDDADALAERLAASPTSYDLLMRFGAACLYAARLRDAQSAFERARALQPDAPSPLLGMACLCDELGQFERAADLLAQARQLDPDDPAIVFGIAFCHERRGARAAARAAYQQAVALCPELRNARERLAALAVAEGDWDAAAEQYAELVEQLPDDVDVLTLLGHLYVRAGRPRDAIDCYQQALLVEPDSGEDGLGHVDRLAAEGALEDAVRQLETLVESNPGAAPLRVQLGDLYVKLGDDVRALAEYQTALAAQPNFLEATVKLGTHHMRQGRFVDAAVTFNRAVELNDRLIAAFAGLGVAQHAAGHTRESEATFDLAASLEPSTTLLFSEALRLRLQAEERAGDGPPGDNDPHHALRHDALLREAVRRHEQALHNTPNHADLHYRHGLLLRQLGRHAEAIQAFRHAVAINPHYAKALVKLAISLKESGATEEAITCFQRAMELHPRFADVHYQLGLLFAQRNRFELAVEEFERALADRGISASFRANLAESLRQIGVVDGAGVTWQAIEDLLPGAHDILAAREAVLQRLDPKSGEKP